MVAYVLGQESLHFTLMINFICSLGHGLRTYTAGKLSLASLEVAKSSTSFG